MVLKTESDRPVQPEKPGTGHLTGPVLNGVVLKVKKKKKAKRNEVRTLILISVSHFHKTPRESTAISIATTGRRESTHGPRSSSPSSPSHSHHHRHRIPHPTAPLRRPTAPLRHRLAPLVVGGRQARLLHRRRRACLLLHCRYSPPIYYMLLNGVAGAWKEENLYEYF
ncbi:uncharacterized protein LOC107468414 [Arachis duranensis]|uniref:Uncharacterized protein LOC107468414 n=1 Tax=Arachis duranensis TaxID=130453 RepID=A0A9C6WNV0_ARADU|nr:uncharacterized protein LOC107468414 [Arachis duranensis]